MGLKVQVDYCECARKTHYHTQLPCGDEVCDLTGMVNPSPIPKGNLGDSFVVLFVLGMAAAAVYTAYRILFP